MAAQWCWRARRDGIRLWEAKQPVFEEAAAGVRAAARCGGEEKRAQHRRVWLTCRTPSFLGPSLRRKLPAERCRMRHPRPYPLCVRSGWTSFRGCVVTPAFRRHPPLAPRLRRGARIALHRTVPLDTRAHVGDRPLRVSLLHTSSSHVPLRRIPCAFFPPAVARTAAGSARRQLGVRRVRPAAIAPSAACGCRRPATRSRSHDPRARVGARANRRASAPRSDALWPVEGAREGA